MASQALYLKWRPQRFEDVVGQEHVTTTLRNALRGGRISHAYLFSGPRGTGKTTMARLLAKAVNCLDEDVDRRPCNECHICRSINEGRLLDLIEMDAASHTGVDNVREAIRDKVGFRPSEARYKVYVIDEVHMLSTSAFNALLKTLEEPPEHVIFCLATTEPHKILPTVLSRCQQFEFHRIPLAALVARLRTIAEQEALRVAEDALQLIARTSAGCARDAISLLDQLTAYGDEEVTVDRVRVVLGLSDEEMVYALLGYLAAHDIGRGLDVVNQAVGQGADMRQFAQQIVEYLRAILLLRVGGGAALPDIDTQTRSHLGTLVERFSTRDLVRSIKLFNQAQLDLRASDRDQLALELAFVEAAMAEEESAAAALTEAAAVERVRPTTGEPRSAAVSVSPSNRLSVPPPAPPRAEKADAPSEDRGPSVEVTSLAVVQLEQVSQKWAEIRRVIRAESRQVEALVNSSTMREIEDGNRLVLEFASEFLSTKLEKEENRSIVESALSSVLGKRCRVRGTLKEAVSPELPAPARALERKPPVRSQEGQDVSRVGQQAPEGSEPTAPDPYQETVSDPVIQDLVERGGQVTDVHLFIEDPTEEE